MSTNQKRKFLSLECQQAAFNKLADLAERPIKGVRKVLIRTSGSNGLTFLLKFFLTEIMIDKKLGDKVVYYSRDKIDIYNSYPPEFIGQMFYTNNPKVIIIDDFQLFIEYSTYWKQVLELVEKTKKKNILIVVGINEDRLYEKESLNKIINEFYSTVYIQKPTTKDIIDLSESILTDYNPVYDLTHNLGLDLKDLLVEIEKKSGYPGNVNTQENLLLTTKI